MVVFYSPQTLPYYKLKIAYQLDVSSKHLCPMSVSSVLSILNYLQFIPVIALFLFDHCFNTVSFFIVRHP